MKSIKSLLLPLLMLLFVVSCGADVPEPYSGMPDLPVLSIEKDSDWGASRIDKESMTAYYNYMSTDRYRLESGIYVMEGIHMLNTREVAVGAKIYMIDEGGPHYKLIMRTGVNGDSYKVIQPKTVMYMQYMDLLKKSGNADDNNTMMLFRDHFVDGYKNVELPKEPYLASYGIRP